VALPVTGQGHPALFALPHFLTANRIHFAEKCSGRRRAVALADGRRQRSRSLRLLMGGAIALPADLERRKTCLATHYDKLAVSFASAVALALVAVFQC
jgi:hypothetical protein